MALLGKYLLERILKGEDLYIPRIGRLYIAKFVRKQKKVDFHQTKLQGKTIYHNDDNTNGYSAHFHWEKAKHLLSKTNFTVKTLRVLSRAIAQGMLHEQSYRHYRLLISKSGRA